jgi:hypothetical protein
MTFDQGKITYPEIVHSFSVLPYCDEVQPITLCEIVREAEVKSLDCDFHFWACALTLLHSAKTSSTTPNILYFFPIGQCKLKRKSMLRAYCFDS